MLRVFPLPGRITGGAGVLGMQKTKSSNQSHSPRNKTNAPPPAILCAHYIGVLQAIKSPALIARGFSRSLVFSQLGQQLVFTALK